MNIVQSVNPADGYSRNSDVVATTREEIHDKIHAAHQAKETWRSMGFGARKNIVVALWNACMKRAEDISQTITREIGTPITACREEVEWNREYVEWFLKHAEAAVAPVVVGEDNRGVHTVQYEPIGVAAVITPWNLPFDMFVWGVIPNLLVGNVVVYKAAEECVLTGTLLEEITHGAGMPPGVLSFVHGGEQEGSDLTDADIDLIWFTGSTSVGQELYQKAGKKFIKALLELGGSNPAIIFADADIESAISSVVSKRFMFSGQTCDAVKRLIVHESVYEQVINSLTRRIASFVIGDPFDQHTTLGPLVSKKQLDLLISQTDDAMKKGAVAIAGVVPPSLRGAWYPPTILTKITKDMRVWREEVFGPVLPVVQFSTEDEAVTFANDTVFGLGCQVYTNDSVLASRVASRIRAGNVEINGVGHFHPYVPFGGLKRSGMGKEHGIDGLRELCVTKVASSPRL